MSVQQIDSMGNVYRSVVAIVVYFVTTDCLSVTVVHDKSVSFVSVNAEHVVFAVDCFSGFHIGNAGTTGYYYMNILFYNYAIGLN